MTTPPHPQVDEPPVLRLCLCGCGQPAVGKKGQWAPGHQNRRPPSAGPLAMREDAIPELEPTGEVRLPKKGEWHRMPGGFGDPQRATVDWGYTRGAGGREILRVVVPGERHLGGGAASSDRAEVDPSNLPGEVAEPGCGAPPSPLDAGDSSSGADPQHAPPRLDSRFDPERRMLVVRALLGDEPAATQPPAASARDRDAIPETWLPSEPAQAEKVESTPPVALFRTSLEPGIHEGVSAAEYHALPYCSNSRLTLLRRSPAHLRADLEHPRAPTDAMRLGTAIHCAVLEPQDFAARYAQAGQCEADTKAGKRCSNPGTVRVGGEWRCGVHPVAGDRDLVEVLSPADFAVCEGVRAALLAHPLIGKLLLGQGRNELTVIWDDEETGIRCKARIDRLVEDFGGVLLDLKSTTDARPDAFMWTVYERGYHRQKPMYQDALRAFGVEVAHLVIVAVEKEAPFGVWGHRLAESSADLGRVELREMMRRYADCQQANSWPCYPTEITELHLPDRAWRQGLMMESA